MHRLEMHSYMKYDYVRNQGRERGGEGDKKKRDNSGRILIKDEQKEREKGRQRE